MYFIRTLLIKLINNSGTYLHFMSSLLRRGFHFPVKFSVVFHLFPYFRYYRCLLCLLFVYYVSKNTEKHGKLRNLQGNWKSLRRRELMKCECVPQLLIKIRRCASFFLILLSPRINDCLTEVQNLQMKT